jgi:acetylornithine deacetylase
MDYFNEWENPMPVTFGLLHSGDWPASAPSIARLEGVFAFLPNLDRDAVCRELTRRLHQAFPDSQTFDLQFTYRHDGFTIDEKHQLPNALVQATRASNYECTPGGMPASSDAWMYHSFLGTPTVLFGAGSLADAHSDHEHVLVEDIRGVCLSLLNLVLTDSSGIWGTE